MKGKKMHRVLLLTLCLVMVITITSALNPVDEADETEEEGVARPIRASSANSPSGTTRKRGRARYHRRRGSGDGTRTAVQKRRLQSSSYRTTRTPLFEASPEDPFSENGDIIEPTTQYGHSHSPPTANPYYSPSKYERERKRKRIKLVKDASLESAPHNSFEEASGEFQKREKNYAFAYAVGDEAEDFSHKQAKDGPITVGEYRITLPDGRTQVVRYTAGGKHGYKADVTYEAPNGIQQDQHHSQHSQGGHPQLKQYHEPVQPTYHLNGGSPAPSFNSNKVYKSRPLKNTALHGGGDIEYSPPSSSGDEELEYHSIPHPTPKIRLMTGGRIPFPHPSPTSADLLNGVSSTPTPRPNSIYDKISPYRNGGKYSGSDELAYAHENSPRAGPQRGGKSRKIAKEVGPTLATYYDSPSHASPSPQPHLPRKVNLSPTKKYKSYYVNGAAAHHQPRTHQANDQYNRPVQHVQYLQEKPIHHHHHADSGILVAKPVKEPAQHVLPIDNHFKSESLSPHASYAPHSVSKPKKLKKIKHGIHTPDGQYLLQSPVTVQTPLHHQHQQQHHQQQQQHHHHQVNSFQTGGQFHSHYYNSFHEPQHHGFGQISASPTPVTSVRHSQSPLPNAYPVTAYPSGGRGSFINEQPRLRLPTQPSQSGPNYLETPVSDERPFRKGIQEALSRLPVNDLPTPKTTIHPYEVGSADYGKSVAYGGGKGRGKGFPDTGYSPFPTGGFHSFDHVDPTNSLFSSGISPSGGSLTGLGSTGGSGQSYFPSDVSDQFNFLDGFHNFDVEQANVREIRQPRPTKRGRKNNSNQNQFSSRRLPRQPDKRRGAPAQSSEEEPTRSPTPRHRQKQTTSTPPRTQTPQSTTTRNRGRRRRMRTQQPDPMMHAVESRRTRPTSSSRSSNVSRRN